MDKMGIYEIKNNKNNKIYIGSSCNVHKRLKQHTNELSRGTHVNAHLQNAWNEDGSNCFEFKLLEIVSDIDKLLEIEQSWLNKTKCYEDDKGYNIAKFTDSNLRRMSKEDILEVAKLHREGVHYKGISEKMNISVATVHEIKNGNLYQEITNLPKVVYEHSTLSDEDVLFIARTCKKALGRGVGIRSISGELMDMFSVTQDIIYSIANGRTWSGLTGIKHRKSHSIRSVETVKKIAEDIKLKLDTKYIAQKHNTTTRYIRRIKNGEFWGDVTGIKYKRKRLSKQQVVSIYKSNLKTKELAKKFNVHDATIRRIKNQETWKSITDEIEVQYESKL